jgi:RHS repeat-associated protein
MGRVTNTTLPDGTSVISSYYPTGLTATNGGSRTYPVAYVYDAQGRMTNMTTWGQAGPEATTWNYDPNRGWLNSKIYADTHGPFYTHTPAGRLASRLWARGTSTTNINNAAGDVASVVYNDGTPWRTNGYDRRGRLTAITNGPTVTTLTLNDAGELLQETNAGGILGGLAVTNGFDGLLRRTTVSFLSPGNVPVTTTYVYDAASRLLSVSDGVNSGTYFYLANSPLVDHVVLAHNGAPVMTNQNTYDHLNRLTGISSALDFNYQYNSAGQRTNVTQLADGSYWLYGYDALGQLTSGNKYFWDGTPVAGQQFDYAFDTIGNRTGTQTGGDQTGGNLRQAAYANNWLNQIANRGVPGYVDVLGLALATNTVSVSGSNAYRKGEYFWEQLAMGNSTSAVWANVTVTSGQASTSGNIFVAQNPETFTYDLDGNLTSDGRWTNTWDAENRLVSMTNLAGAPAGSQCSLSFAYDYMGRRIQKVVSPNSGASYTNRFVYDGWNVVAILDGANNLLYSFTWGADLSGSMQGAGGVGGAISMTVYSGANAGTYFYCYDGNGNVAALVNAANGNVAAQYEYGPFGEVIRATGLMAKVNPFMFSTKFYDWETGLYYYPYRYYNPSTGRWLSRDPIAEKGGLNLYGFIHNAPINDVDSLGLLVGQVSVLRWMPWVENGTSTYYFGPNIRGWIANFEWTPPTTGSWALACNCKPCQQVLWTQQVAIGRGSQFSEDWGPSYAIKHGFVWDCGKNSDATLWDNPDQHGNFVSMFTSPYNFYARSVATCTKGTDAGKAYATVLWGFQWTYDKTPTGLGPIIY